MYRPVSKSRLGTNACPLARIWASDKLQNIKYGISPCIMQCFFLDIHVTKRHLVLYIDVEFKTFF